ncbi:hypothetical protein EN745_26805, partial [Mesorhizobium sp. M4A.F.Ca.ET.022.05.2.1]
MTDPALRELKLRLNHHVRLLADTMRERSFWQPLANTAAPFAHAGGPCYPGAGAAANRSPPAGRHRKAMSKATSRFAFVSSDTADARAALE